jgi:predicted Rdx family selenoprotein
MRGHLKSLTFLCFVCLSLSAFAASVPCRFDLTSSSQQVKIETTLDKNIRVVGQDHAAHWLMLNPAWDILFTWRDPYPLFADDMHTFTINVGAQVERAGPGAISAGITIESDGTAIWNVKRNDGVGAGRWGNGQVGTTGSGVAEFDLCNQQGNSPAKPNVAIRVVLNYGGGNKVIVAQYFFTRTVGPGISGGSSGGGAGGSSGGGSGSGYSVGGQIGVVWQSLGGKSGPGAPTSPEQDAAPSPYGTRGRYQNFANGQIVWNGSGSRAGQAYFLTGAILARYNSIGGTASYLGFPLSSEAEASASPFGTTGRYNLFENGVMIWERNGRAPGHVFIVQGAIAQLYQSMGGTASWLGMPTSDEYDYNGGRRSDFEGGSIVWTSSGGAKAIRGH